MKWNFHPIRARQQRKIEMYATIGNGIAETVSTLLRQNPVEVKHVVRHEPRPPAPRPARITITYVMQDGREYREYIPLNGQAEWTTNYPQWLTAVFQGNEPPPQYIRYSLGYNDGGV